MLPPQVRAVIDASVKRQEEWRSCEAKTFDLTHGPLVFHDTNRALRSGNYRRQVANLSKAVGIGYIGTQILHKSADIAVVPVRSIELMALRTKLN